MRADAALVVALLLLVGGVATTPAADSTTSETSIDVHLLHDGHARLNVSAHYVLETDNETRAFRRLASDWANGQADAGISVDPFRQFVAAAEDRTGRNMTIEAVERSWSVHEVPNASEDRHVGRITLTFRWTNMSPDTGDTVTVGDAFGRWELDEGQVVRIHPPAGYAVQSVDPQTNIEQGVVAWEGPITFETGNPSVTYVPSGPGDDTTTNPGEDDGATALVPVFAALIVGGLVAYGWTQRDQLLAVLTAEAADEEATETDAAAEDSGSDGGDGGDDDGTAGAAAAAETADDGAADDSAADDGAAVADEAGATGTPETDMEAASAAATAEAAQDEVDEALLTDEERVERLVESNGGRMRQAAIVEETGWSNAKVSQLLSSMADEERVEKLRIGRENLISLPDTGDDESGE